MKKICILFSLMIMLLCSGCIFIFGIGGMPNMEPILEGTYASYDEENTEVFSDAKFTIKEITKEEYEEANGENVFIDASTYFNEEKRYIFIELYLYSVETEQYELATLNDLEYKEGTGHCYKGKITLNIDEDIYFEEDSAHFTFYFGSASAEVVYMALSSESSKEFSSHFRLQ